MPREQDAPRSQPRPRSPAPDQGAGPGRPRLGPSPAPPPPTAPAADHDERWTVGRLLTWTADFLKRRGAESPRLDAEVLLAQVLGWERVQLYTHYEEEVGERHR